MSAGRGSRLSQVLQHTKEIREFGSDYDHDKGPPGDLGTLSVLGIGDFANALLSQHKGVQSASENLNAKYLQQLSFAGAQLEGSISVSGSKGERLQGCAYCSKSWTSRCATALHRMPPQPRPRLK